MANGQLSLEEGASSKKLVSRTEPTGKRKTKKKAGSRGKLETAP